MWGLVTKKKLEVRKIDAEVNIVDFMTKPLLDQCFRTRRTRMGLRQTTESKSSERGVEDKSKSGPIKRVDKAKSKE